jgi:peptidoglycan/xylan/chitin deacetylase (PgdA/CDA1 family)
MDRRGFVYYDWNVSGNDSIGSPTLYSINKNINKDLTRYQLPVVLLHDGKPNKLTAQNLSGIIDSIRGKGYSFGVLEERFPCQFRY